MNNHVKFCDSEIRNNIKLNKLIEILTKEAQNGESNSRLF